MRARIIFFTATGVPIFSMDGAHGDEHAQRVIAENTALLRAQGIEPVIVEFDPVHSGNDALADMGQLSAVALEIRTRPDGQREALDIHVRHAGGRRSIQRALRVLQAPADITNPRAVLHRRARSPSA